MGVSACVGRRCQGNGDVVHSRYLGRSDVRLSEIALGTWGLADGAYGPVAKETFEATVRAAWDAGVTTFDLSPLWGRGASERITAEALGANKKNAVFITRVGQVESGDRVMQQFEAISVGASIDQSLERLDRDWVDVVLLHNPPMEALTKERFQKAVGGAMASGKVRSWGISTSTLEEARVALKLGAQVICLPHNLLAPDDVEEITPLLKENGAGVLARSPLAFGMLSGTITKDTVFPAGDHRRDRWTETSRATRLARVEELRALAKDGDVVDLALRFVLSNAFVASALVGARTPDQIRSAARSSVGAPYLENLVLKQIAGLPK
jgi:aryl-alcohol dehydrogenase-like predicted oxidoreductase